MPEEPSFSSPRTLYRDGVCAPRLVAATAAMPLLPAGTEKTGCRSEEEPAADIMCACDRRSSAVRRLLDMLTGCCKPDKPLKWRACIV